MKIKKADEVPSEAVAAEGARGAEIRLLIHEADGATNFYMRQFTLAAGGCTPLHAHQWEHEIYVLAGRGAMDSADGAKPVEAGFCVFVAPNEKHRVRNAGPGPLKFLCLIPKT